MSFELEQLRSRLGISEPLPHLETALTHRSFAAENGLHFDYQRLEFLGDAVLETLFSELLFARYPEAGEGELSQMRAALVREESFAAVARHLELGPRIRLGKGEREAGGAERNSVLADVFEAVIGAIHLDAGPEAARKLVARLAAEMFPDPAALTAEINPKGSLQELTQGRWGEQPEYRVLRTSGPDHAPTFEVEVRVHRLAASGIGEGRRAAESEAARKLLTYIKEKNL